MTFREMVSLWQRFADLGGAPDPTALREAVCSHAQDLELPPAQDFVPFTSPDVGDALLFWCSDQAVVCGLTWIPADRLDAQLREDLARLNGCAWAGAGDLSSEPGEASLWDAALRVMSALALEMSTVEDMARWGQDEGSSLTADDLAPYWKAWLGCEVTSWAQLSTLPAQVCAIRQAM